MSFLVRHEKTFKITPDWHLDVSYSDTETETSILESDEITLPAARTLSKSFSALSCIESHRDVECESSSSSDSGYEADTGLPQAAKRRHHSFGPDTLKPLNLDKICSGAFSEQESSSDARPQRSLSLSSPEKNLPIIKVLKIEGKAPVKEIFLNLKEKEPITGKTYHTLMQECFKKGDPFDVAVAIPDKRTAHVFYAAKLKWNPKEDSINPVTGKKIEKIWWFSNYGNFQNFVYNGNSSERTQKIGSRINKNSPRSKHVKSLPLGNGINCDLDLGDTEPLTGRSYRALMNEHFETPKQSYSVAVVTEKGRRRVLDAAALGWDPDKKNKNPKTGNPIKNICWLSIHRGSEDFNYIAGAAFLEGAKTLEFENSRLNFRLEQKEPITGSTYRNLMLAQPPLTLAVAFEEIPYIFRAENLGKWDRGTKMLNPVTGNVIEKIWWFEIAGENQKLNFIASSEDTSEQIASQNRLQSPRSGSFIQKLGSQIKMSPRKDGKS